MVGPVLLHRGHFGGDCQQVEEEPKPRLYSMMYIMGQRERIYIVKPP